MSKIFIEQIDPETGEYYNESCRSGNNESSDIFIKEVDPETGEEYDNDEYYDDDEDDFSGLDESVVLEKSSIELILEAISNMNDVEFNEFVRSEEFDILVEAGKFTKNTIISLNRNDELKKRASIIAINIEKEKNSALYQKYEKAKRTMMACRKEIINKNFNKANKLAQKQLKAFTKSININKIPVVARALDNKKSRSL